MSIIYLYNIVLILKLFKKKKNENGGVKDGAAHKSSERDSAFLGKPSCHTQSTHPVSWIRKFQKNLSIKNKIKNGIIYVSLFNLIL